MINSVTAANYELGTQSSGLVEDRPSCVCLKLVGYKTSANIFLPVGGFMVIILRADAACEVSWVGRKEGKTERVNQPNKIYLVLSFESVSFVSELRITEAAGSIDN